MEEHKFILASDTRDLLGNWTEPSVIDDQSLPAAAAANGARGIGGPPQGVGMTKQKGTRKQLGGGQQMVLTEHFTQRGLEAGGAAATHVIVGHPVTLPSASSSAGNSYASPPMINTLKPAKTKLGKERIRMKWTQEVNEYILRTYYTITQLETNCKHYRDTLHRLFNEHFPDVEVCAQRIADQRRAIVKNHLLTQERIEAIWKEVAQELQMGGGAVQPERQQIAASVAGGTPIILATPVMAVSKEQPPTMTVWYGCVKDEQAENSQRFAVAAAGPSSSHKLRKLNHGASVAGDGGQQQPQPQHIIIQAAGAIVQHPPTTNALKR